MRLELRSAGQALTTAEVQKMDAYWRACNYICAGMLGPSGPDGMPDGTSVAVFFTDD